jgi:hypothetical protein
MGMPWLLTPLAGMAAVILVVAIIFLAKVHDQETEVRFKLHAAEMEHQRKMKELDLELEKVRESAH